jgi:hypothetical protein
LIILEVKATSVGKRFVYIKMELAEHCGVLELVELVENGRLACFWTRKSLTSKPLFLYALLFWG